MNRNYKVIWNRSLGCFTAVAEYAKSRGKSSKSSVSSNATINTTSNISSASIFRMTTLGLGLVVAGFSMQAIAAPCDGSAEVKCGTNATVGALNGIAIGKNATVLGSQGIAIGGGSSGQNTTASGDQSIAIGANVVSSGASSIAIGGDDLDTASKTNFDGSISTGALNSGQVNTTFNEYAGRDLLESWDAYGVYTEASGAASIAMGAKARSAGNLATAMGIHSSASGIASSAFGVASSATGQGALALGAGAKSLTQDGVALGSRSVANIAGGAAGFAPTSASVADKAAITATNSTSLGAVSLGNAKDGTRQIVNLAAGTKDSDAVNVSQLKSLTNIVSEGQTHYYSVNDNGVAKANYNNDGATGGNSMAAGIAATAGGTFATAIGTDANAQGYASTALGNEADATKTNSLALGRQAKATGTNSTALGWEASASAENSMALGRKAMATGANNIALGREANTSGRNSTALGLQASASANNSMALGTEAKAMANKSIALGEGANATHEGSVALGSGSVADGTTLTTAAFQPLNSNGSLIAVAAPTAKSEVSVGSAGSERRITNVAAGATDTDAVNVSQLTGSAAASKTEVEAGTNVAVTNNPGVNGQNVYTIDADGTTASAGSAAVTVTPGTKGADNLTDYAVDLSQASKDSLVKANNSVQYDNPAQTSVTLGGVGAAAPVVLTNIAAGDLSTTSTDAVNGSQLHATNTVVNKGFGLKAADGNTVMKPLGEQVEVVGSNSNITTKVIGGKIAVALNNDLDLGATGSVTMGKAGFLGLGPVTTVNSLGVFTGNVLGSTAVTGAGISLNGSLGIPSTTLTTNGLNIIGGPSVTKSGIDAGNKKITRVDAGVAPTDAVNVSQLTGSAAASKTEVEAGTNVAVTNNPGVNGQNVYTIDADGTTASAGSAAVTVTPGTKGADNLTDYAVDLSQASKDSLSSADSALQSVVTQIDGVAVKTITKADNTANFLKGDNILLTPESGGIKVALAKDLTGLNSVTTGNTVMNTSGVSFTGSTVNLSGTGLNNGGNQITNVKAGTEDMDAVNVGQLNLANTTIDKGLNFGGDSGTDVNRKLGQKLIVKGGDTINADSATKNISVTANGDDTLTVRLAKDINLGETGSVTTGNTQVNNAGITLYRGDNGQVVLTNNGLNNGNNKITNVAAGLLSATSKDAVNGSQLFKTNEDVAKGIKFDLNGTTKTYALGEAIQVATDANITTTAFGNGAKFGLADTIKIGGTSANAVSIDGTAGIVKGLTNTTFDASTTYTGGQAATQEQLSGLQSGISDTFDKGISFGGDNAPTTIKRKLGEKIIVKGGVSDPTKLTDSNIGVIADGTDTLTVKLAKDLTGLNSASFGNDVMISSNGLRAGTTVINTGGVSFSGSTVSLSSSGLNNGGNVITNVARGEATTDAVNVGQLNEVKQSAADANKGWNVSAQGANTSTVKPSDKVDLNNTDNNITVSKTAESNNVSFNLSKDIAVDSVKTGDATMNSSGLTIAGGPKFTKTSIDAAGNKITNVANGLVGINSKEAINGGQLNEVIAALDGNTDVLAGQMNTGLNFGADSGVNINKKIGDGSVLGFKGGNNIKTTAEGSSIKFDLNGNINVESVTTGNTTVNNSGVTIKNGPSMTAAGIYAGNAETAPSMTAAGINAAGTKVTNVADGMAPRDAVNFGQLDAVSRGLGNSINELGYRVDEVEDDANAGISAAMAMSSLPQAYIIGKSMIGGGIATYNGESAVAIGFSKLSDDGRWVMKLNGTADTQGNVGAAIGAGFHFD
ncbi:YadA-like family protein [Psychrobacter sp. DAB_AL62B]|uniref:YadA-like family protein n=1 Tax=Psychrobacter sp. DAB_AL62B TaxID=1028420 RepID=UPI0023815058|nr:YadA-like family protein [Psychrobacter sp. DAB_AL62B]MDE4453885.1 hypothetical protein [Psychrobacter sp. DAB_AL62B]